MCVACKLTERGREKGEQSMQRRNARGEGEIRPSCTTSSIYLLLQEKSEVMKKLDMDLLKKSWPADPSNTSSETFLTSNSTNAKPSFADLFTQFNPPFTIAITCFITVFNHHLIQLLPKYNITHSTI